MTKKVKSGMPALGKKASKPKAKPVKSDLEFALEFLKNSEGANKLLLDRIASDLKINVDYKNSKLYNIGQQQFVNVSFQEIVEKTRDRIINALKDCK